MHAYLIIEKVTIMFANGKILVRRNYGSLKRM